MQDARPAARTPRVALAALALAAAAPPAAADQNGAMLQWFEASRNTIERRMPDFFKAGYKSVWLPPQSLAADRNGTGYDVFDRFDLGRPGTDQFGASNATVFGTEADFDAMREQFHRAAAFVYVDTILNHNSGRNGDGGFLAEGDYPGFYIKGFGADFWGDFNDGSTQSQNPCDPNYNLFDGDLVGLIDIDQASNNWTIRHPVNPNLPEGLQPTEGDALANPVRIPSGTRWDQPKASNAAFYPDLSLAPTVVNNPGFGRISSGFGCGGCCFPLFPGYAANPMSVTIHPFNTDDPMAGDPVPENATGLLVRWCRWMLEVKGVDGFRLDAAKHTPQWFWDDFYDTHVHNRWRKPDGTLGTPFSFVEAVAGNFDVYQQYVRKDGFANRDALDLSGAGNIRNIINGKGGAFAGDMIAGHIDPEDDGFNNGSVGVNHIYSHDNGSTGDGGSAPGVAFEDKVAPWAHAYLLLRTGPPIVYHNAREFHGLGVNRFWPREGVPTALGFGTINTLPGPVTETAEDDRIPTLVRLRNRYARNFFIPKVQDAATYIYTRQGNCVVAMNDNFNTGFEQRTFTTAFAPGTRLHELTGNAMDPEVDPTDQIFDVVTVAAGGQVTIRVPGNGGASNEHNKGYVVYGPATPSGALAIETAGGAPLAEIPADPPSDPPFLRRLTSLPIVQDAQFQIRLNTTQTDALDPNTDDRAIFRINQGYLDANGNGGIGENTGEFDAYEDFLTENDPLFGGGSGTYRQVVDTDLLPEGPNYISVIAFRRGGGALGDPLYNEWREVVYVDRRDPPIEVTTDLDCLTGNGNVVITNPDFTATEVYAFLDLAPGDPTPPLGSGEVVVDWDRNVWLVPVTGLGGTHTIRVVAEERQNGVLIRRAETQIEFTVDDIAGDVNDDGVVDLRDLYAFEALAAYECRADLNADEINDEIDRGLLRDLVGADELEDVLDPR